MRSKICKCGRVKERRHAGSCNVCHAAYTKEWKKRNPLTDEQKERYKEVRRASSNKRLEGIRKRNTRYGAKPGIRRPLCSWCNAIIENFKKKNYCKKCAAKYNREWRKKNAPSKEQKFRDMVRVKTYYAIAKGILIRQPCEVCGELKVEAHHDNYHKAFDVRWLCGHHHREHHMLERKRNASTSSNNE